MKKILITFFLFLPVLLCAGSSDQIKWYSFDEGLAKAQKEGKLFILEYFRDDCPICAEMHDTTLKDKKLIKRLNKETVPVILKRSKTNESFTFKGKLFNAETLAQAFQIKGTPWFGFFDSTGRPVMAKSGIITIEDFNLIIDSIISGDYKKYKNFDEYKKSRNN